MYGEQSWEQKIKASGKVFDKYTNSPELWDRILNKVVQSVGPVAKIPIEGLLGEKMFPSITNRQPITDQGRWMAEQFGLHKVYDVVTGRPSKPYWTKEWVVNKAAYTEDKNRLGWLALSQAVSEYERTAGLDSKGFMVTDAGTALYNFGLAWRYGDKEAASKYLAEYVTINATQLKGISSRVIQEQWEKLFPAAKLTEKHRKIFMAQFLSTERGRKQFESAIKYYAEISSGVQFIRRGK